MSNTKIGLDFGTHQTKVCIVDSSDRRNRRYLFHPFFDLQGIERLTIPSLVQINDDNTLSYGYVDARRAKMVRPTDTKLIPKKPQEPVYRSYQEFPPIPKPQRPAILDENPHKRDNVISLFSDLREALFRKEKNGGKSHKQLQEEAKMKYENEMAEYRELSNAREQSVAQNRAQTDQINARLRSEYEDSLEKYWHKIEELDSKRIPQVFRYFKQAVFSTGMKWEHEISPMLISIWYLTFVFFQLDKKYDTLNLTVSMGTSSGVQTWKSNKKKATEIILTVYDLIERVYDHDENRFLKATIDELKSVTKIVNYSDEKKEENAIFVFPEAIANLQPLAQRKAFATGLNLLVDIGGGTTDISLFAAPTGEEVKVFDYQSLPFGINSIDDGGEKPHFSAVLRAVNHFTRKLENYAYSIHVPQSEVNKIVNKRNIVFTGGGSSRNELIRPYAGFTEIIRFKERFFNLIPTDGIQDVSDELHVLSTALGLAMAKEDDKKIPMIGYEQLFAQVAKAYENCVTNHGRDHYEHGLSDY